MKYENKYTTKFKNDVKLIVNSWNSFNKVRY